MSEDQDKRAKIADRLGFAETPSKDEWLGLLRDLSEDLAAIELRIEHIKTCELLELEHAANNIRARIDMIALRLSR